MLAFDHVTMGLLALGPSPWCYCGSDPARRRHAKQHQLPSTSPLMPFRTGGVKRTVGIEMRPLIMSNPHPRLCGEGMLNDDWVLLQIPGVSHNGPP